jgi:hypothetical protein
MKTNLLIPSNLEVTAEPEPRTATVPLFAKALDRESVRIRTGIRAGRGGEPSDK